MLNNLEKIRIYRAIIRLMQEEEKSDSKKSKISGRKLLELSEKRYIKMQEILSSLKKALSEEFEITNMYFSRDMQDDSSIIVEYKKDDEQRGFFTISKYDDDVFEVSFDLSGKICNELITKNRKIIKEAFRLGDENNFEHELNIPSTSKLFYIRNNCDGMLIADRQSSSLTINFNYNTYNNKLLVTHNVLSVYPQLMDCLRNNDVNLTNFIKHVQVYEENVPKYLKVLK